MKKKLSSDLDDTDKEAALLGVYMLILHEFAHYGDYLDGIRMEGGEPGYNLESLVWWFDDEGDEYTTDDDKFNESTQKEIIKKKKEKGVIPTLPRVEFPGSAGPADRTKENSKK